jgi:hypothetical protein
LTPVRIAPRFAAGALAFVVPILLCTAGAADSDRTKQHLDSVAPTEAREEAGLRAGQDEWTGPEDLSFVQRIAVRDGVVQLWVEVTDDDVVPSGGELLADHVEVRLADAGMVEARSADVAGLQDQGTWNADTADPGDGAECGEQRALAVRRALAEYEATPCCLQASFDDRSPGYRRTSHGYEVVTAIPLLRSLDAKGVDLRSLRFLIEVFDVDHSSGPPTVMASPATGRRGEPTTFGTLRLEQRWPLPVGSDDRLASALAPDGYFRAGRDGYTFVTDAQEPREVRGCAYNIVVPHYSSGQVRNLSKLEDLRILAHRDKVIVANDRSSRIIQVTNSTAPSEIGLVFQHHVGDRYYLVLDVVSPSSWPPSYHACGGSEESSLAWLELDEALEVRRQRHVSNNSCFGDPGTLVTGGRIVWTEPGRESPPSDRPAEVLYDDDHPGAGFTSGATSLP